MSLIFEPGFSTSQVVSGISGRGVGMDAVLSKVKSLGGDIEVASEKGEGCQFLIKLPKRNSVWVERTLAVCSEDRYIAIPLDSVVSIESSKSLSPLILADKTFVPFQGAHWNLVDFQSRSVSPNSLVFSKPYIAFLKFKKRGIALAFEEILGQFDVVVQDFDESLNSQRGYRGVSYLNQEEIAYVLQPDEFISACFDRDSLLDSLSLGEIA
jgi:chemotaxis protein histidine kinase CheA